ncbi:MAG: hypothetical protein KF778_16965 [Rhodocyclaceae bacterium]|nr:hypothetical protein [Rhodocyclaceae bacterium]
MSDGTAETQGTEGWLSRACKRGKAALCSTNFARLILRAIAIYAILSIPYWLFAASNRYVSNANVIIQKTDQLAMPGLDIPALFAGTNAPNRADQLLLREYLLSEDMLNKLDATLDLRSHFSDWHHDPVSRMWFRDAPMEWFYRHWLSRVDVTYDDFSGVLHIQAQAYTPELAQKIVALMVREGEAHMNKMDHELAQVQVDFLTKQVGLAHERLLEASHGVLEFQNRNGLVAPQATAESVNMLIEKLEAQKTAVETQLASLPASIGDNQPAVVMLRKNRDALQRQIASKRAELASPSRRTLNATVEEFQRLQMAAEFVRDVYKTALAALEKGRMDAARTLKKVSLVQAPTHPSYPEEPTRIYNIALTLLVCGAIAGILKLLHGIILDHVD